MCPPRSRPTGLTQCLAFPSGAVVQEPRNESCSINNLREVSMRFLVSIPVLLAVLAANPLSIAHAEDCFSNAVTQGAMNACANEAYEKSDAELNALYKQILKRLKN